MWKWLLEKEYKSLSRNTFTVIIISESSCESESVDSDKCVRLSFSSKGEGIVS